MKIGHEIPGYKVVQSLPSRDRYGVLYVVELIDDLGRSAPLVAEVVDFQEVPPELADEIRAALVERSEVLQRRPLAYVTPIIANYATPSGDWCTIRLQLDGWVADLVQPQRGAVTVKESARLEAWVTQLLTALAALHEAKLSFGDLRLSDLQYTQNSTRQPNQLWLTGAELGTLSELSFNHLRRPSRNADSPAELEFSPANDLVRLGRQLAELLGNKHGRPNSFTRLLKGVPPTQRLIARLTTSVASERLADGGAALDYWRGLQREHARAPLRSAVRGLAGVLGLGLLVAAWWGWSMGGQLAGKLQEVSELNEQNAKLDAENKALIRSRSIGTTSDVVGIDRQAGEEIKAAMSPVPANWQEFNRRVDGRLSELKSEQRRTEVRSRIDKAIGELSSPATYFCDFTAASGPSDAGIVAFQLTIYVDENDDAETLSLEDLPLSSNAAGGTKKTTTIRWKSGQNIQVILEPASAGILSAWNHKNLVNKTFTGPAAIWELQGWLQGQSVDGYKIFGDVRDSSLNPLFPAPNAPKAPLEEGIQQLNLNGL